MQPSSPSILDFITKKLIQTGKEYLSQRNAGSSNNMELELNVMAQATLLDRLSDSNLGTQMWMLFQFQNHEDWEESVWMLLRDFETAKQKQAYFETVAFYQQQYMF